MLPPHTRELGKPVVAHLRLGAQPAPGTVPLALVAGWRCIRRCYLEEMVQPERNGWLPLTAELCRFLTS